MFNFGGAAFWGSTGDRRIPYPIISMAATRLGYPYQQGATGYDISWPQCGSQYPPSSPVSVVGVNNGLSHNAGGTDITRNPCLTNQAAWAGPNLTVYINLDGVPDGNPAAAANGPAGPCGSDLICRGYNWGWDTAVRSVQYAHSLGLYPTVWWLDVEQPCGYSDPNLPLWRCGGPNDLPSNANVVQGALAGIQANSLIAGIYSTYLQWPATVGTAYNPGVPIWVPGASNMAAAAARCTDSRYWFAGGRPWLAQWFGPFDGDYACPQT
jgi:hypothetical protein